MAEQLRSNGMLGTGRFDPGAIDDLPDPFTMTGEFTLNSKAVVGGQAVPAGLGGRRRPGTFLLGERFAGRQLPFVCYAGRQVEEIDLTFADGLPLPIVPKAREIETAVLSFTADARLDGRTVRIRREFVSRVAGQVCASDLESEIAGPLKSIAAIVQAKLTLAKAGNLPGNSSGNSQRQD